MSLRHQNEIMSKGRRCIKAKQEHLQLWCEQTLLGQLLQTKQSLSSITFPEIYIQGKLSLDCLFIYFTGYATLCK